MFEIAIRLYRHRGLVATLTARELKARYRGSSLGFLWSLVNPLLLLAVYSVVFGYLLPTRADKEPYALYLICGLFPWIWASSSLLDGATCLSSNAGFIKKALFPMEVLPAVAVGAQTVHFLIALPILGAALLSGRLLGYPVGGVASVWLPVAVLLELVFLAGGALGLAALHVHFKDVRDLLQNLLTLLFFLTPILYTTAEVGSRSRFLPMLLWCNPFTPFTHVYQKLLFEGGAPDLWVWLYATALALGSWGLGSLVFARLADTIPEAL